MASKTTLSPDRDKRWPIGGSMAAGELAHWSALSPSETSLIADGVDRVTAEWSWDQLDQWTRWDILRAIGLHESRLLDDAAMFDAYARAMDERTLLWLPAGGPGDMSRRRPGEWYSSPSAQLVEELTTAALKAAPEPTTWIAVEILDDAGEPVPGVEMVFDVDGGEHSVLTDGAGVVRLMGVRGSTGVARLANIPAVWTALEARWNRENEAERQEPSPGSMVVEVWPSLKSPSIPLQAESRKLIILDRPYRVKLYDDQGKVMAGLACRVSVGGAQYHVKSDDGGWLAFPVGQNCADIAIVEWDAGEHRNRREVALLCCAGDPQAVARARLRNLGYVVDGGDVGQAVAKFQVQFDLSLEDVGGDGTIPAAVLDQIADLWGDLHD